MLVLSRKHGQAIVIDDRIRVVVLGARSSAVRLGIDAPVEIPIVREELDVHSDVAVGADRAGGHARYGLNQIAEAGGLI